MMNFEVFFIKLLKSKIADLQSTFYIFISTVKILSQKWKLIHYTAFNILKCDGGITDLKQLLLRKIIKDQYIFRNYFFNFIEFPSFIRETKIS